MNKIQSESAIWDLHIHTCMCPKRSNEFSNMSVETYVNEIIKIFNEYEDLQLFSFTDHNKISIPVYEEYIKQGGKTKFLVGVEQDTFFEDSRENYKHLIIYFDINAENFENRKEFLVKYNDFVKNSEKSIFELLSFLSEQSIRFVLSPHAFKQNERGINYEWNDEIIVQDKAHKYTDQFFCFWEAQGFSEISRAEQFLKAFDLEEKISIISFSDSNNFIKLRNYLDKPNQWFKSLPTYKGLELIATENSRISKDKQVVLKNNYGNLIGKISINNCDIELSDKLNCIIGGRGSGKSILLDSIALSLKEIDLDKKRKEYLQKLDIQTFNFSGTSIDKDNFSFDYYEQSYVSKIFQDNNYYDKIKNYFSKDLDKVKDIDCEEIKEKNKSLFKELISTNNQSIEPSNISCLFEQYINLEDSTFKLSFPTDRKKTTLISYENNKLKKDSFLALVPKQIREDYEINQEIEKLLKLVFDKIHSYNINHICNVDIINIFKNKYNAYKKSQNQNIKNKLDVEKNFKDTFYLKSKKYILRVNIINAFLELEKDFCNKYENKITIDAEKENAFSIKKRLDIERPVEYLNRKFAEYFYLNELKNVNGELDLKKSIEYYCFNTSKKLKEGKNIENLDEDLLSFDLKYDYHPQIEYLNENYEYEDIFNVSPGSQTNILMEYLVYKDTDKPLLIDQPEDNVDNQTIYNKLRIWFSKLKHKRQVIVVTHDANIVINSDAENIIVASHPSIDKFDYMYGALEYGTNLDVASNILDGGKEAVKRRLKKYGSEQN